MHYFYPVAYVCHVFLGESQTGSTSSTSSGNGLAPVQVEKIWRNGVLQHLDLSDNVRCIAEQLPLAHTTTLFDRLSKVYGK